MSTVFHILSTQSVPQEQGGGIGVPIEVIGATAIACALLTATVILLTRFRRRRDPTFMRERHAREQMQQLCPDGWMARIVLYGKGAPLPDDVPGDRNVCVEWAEYEKDKAGHTEVAVVRRMWARTISGALRGMIADRELDLELEKIERKVIDDNTTGGETGPPAAGSHGTTDR